QQHTRDHRLLMHIQPTTARIDDLHGMPTSRRHPVLPGPIYASATAEATGDRAAGAKNEQVSSACSPLGREGRQSVTPGRTTVSFPAGSRVHQTGSDLGALGPLPAYPIFTRCAERPSHVAFHEGLAVCPGTRRAGERDPSPAAQ